MGALTAKAALPLARVGLLSECLAELRERLAEMLSFSMGRTGRHEGAQFHGQKADAYSDLWAN